MFFGYKWSSWLVLRPSCGVFGRSWSPLPPPPALERNGSSLACTPSASICRTSTSLNLTPLNLNQPNSSLDPPRRPFWSLLGRQIDRRSAKVASWHIVQKLSFSQNKYVFKYRMVKNDPKTATKPTQDRLKTALSRCSRASFFVFDFGSSWVRMWPHLGSPLDL